MGRNKKQNKMRLKKSLSNVTDKNDSIAIANKEKNVHNYEVGISENLENIDFEPSLLKHIKNIRNIDENVLVWNSKDSIDIKANERFPTSFNISRVKQSMQESPFSKYLEDQIDDLNKISKASISGMNIIKEIVDSTNMSEILVNIGDKIQKNNSNKSKNLKKEILYCRTNNVDCDPSSSNNDINRIDQYTGCISDEKSACYKSVSESINQPSSIKESSFHKKSLGKYHKNETKSNIRRSDNMKEVSVCKKPNKDDTMKNDEHLETTGDSIVSKEVDTVFNEDKTESKEVERNMSEKGIVKVANVITGKSKKSNIVGVTEDTLSPLHIKSVSESGTSDGTSLVVNDPLLDMKRKRVRPSQLNDYIVEDKSLDTMFGRRHNTPTNISCRDSSSSDNKIHTRTRRRSASIEAESKLTKIFNLEQQLSLEQQEITEIWKVSQKCDISEEGKSIMKKVSGRVDLEKVDKKQNIGIKEILVDDETKLETKYPPRMKGEIINEKDGGLVDNTMTNIGPINNQLCVIDNDKVSNKPQSADLQKAAKKQTLVEWDTLIAKQKAFSNQSNLIKGEINKKQLIKRKHKVKTSQTLLHIQNSSSVRKSINKQSAMKEERKSNKEKKAVENMTSEKSIKNNEIDQELIVEFNKVDQSTVKSQCEVRNEAQVVEESAIKEEVSQGNIIIKCDKPVKRVKIKRVHRRRKNVDLTDIDAIELMHEEEVDGRLKKCIVPETIVDPYSGGPRVKHVSRLDVTNLDSNKKKCIVKTIHKSSRKSAENADSLYKESINDGSHILDATAMGSCDQTSDQCVAGASVCHNIGHRIPLEAICGINCGNAEIVVTQGDGERNHVVSHAHSRDLYKHRSSLDVYRDNGDSNSSHEEEEEEEEAQEGDDVPSEIFRCGNINAIKSEDITLMLAYDGGYPIVTSRKAMPNKVLCYSCGSGGDQMIHCVSCAEPFHFFCIEFQFRPKSKEMFVCRNCTRCHLCNKYGTDLKCLKCQLGFHPSCVDRYPPSWSADRSKWVCYKCAMCVHCGTMAQDAMKGESSCDWDSDPWQCGRCARLRKTGLVCPDCDRALRGESDTLQCVKCARLVHRQCVGLNEDEFEVLKRMARVVPDYKCRKCDEGPSVSVRESVVKSLCENRVASLKTDFIDRVKNKERELLMCDDTVVTRMCDEEVMGDQVDGGDDSNDDIDDDTQCYQALTRIQVADDDNDDSSQSVDQWNVTSDDDTVIGGVNAVLIGLCTRDYETVRHLVMECLARVMVKMCAVVTQTDMMAKYEALVNFLKSLSVIIFPWIDIDHSVIIVRSIVTQYSARLSLVVASVATIVRDLQQREMNVFSTSVHDIERRLSDSLMKGRQEFIEYHSERHLCALVEVMEGRSGGGGGGTSLMVGQDGRQCSLCGAGGDDSVEGRMLYGGVDVWVHVNCALWSDEVYETESGALCNVGQAIERGQRQRCGSCERLGASVSCVTTNCSGNYHLPCALMRLSSDPVLTVARTLYCCEEHCGGDIEDQARVELADMLVLRRVYVPLTDPRYQRRVLCASDDIVVTIGSLCIDQLGTITPQSFTHHHLSPLGYKARRLFWSVSDPDSLTTYTMTTKECTLSDYHRPTVKRPHSKETTQPLTVTTSKRRPLSGGHQVMCDIDALDPDHTDSSTSIHRDNRQFPKVDVTTNKKTDPTLSTMTNSHSPTIINRYFTGTKKKKQSLLNPDKCRSSLLRRVLTHSMPPITHNQTLMPPIIHNQTNIRPIIRNHTSIPPITHNQNSIRPIIHNQTRIPPIIRNQTNIRSIIHNQSHIPSSVRCPVSYIVTRPSTQCVTPDYIVQLDGQVDYGDDNMDDCVIVPDPITALHSPLSVSHLQYLIDGVASNRSPKYAWTIITRKLSLARNTLSLTQCHIKNGDGWSKFGLEHRSVVYLIEQMMSSVQLCPNYQFKYHKVHNHTLQRSVQSTMRYHHSSRSSEWPNHGHNSRHRDPLSFLLSKINKTPRNHAPDQIDMTNTSEEDRDIDTEILTADMKSLTSGAMARVVDVRVAISDIHGRGVFARRQYEPHQFIIEYVGERIRPLVSEARARQYRHQGTDCYMFSLDKDTIIDATRMGNASRFINHSCQPNCYSRIVQYKATKHIIMVAQRRIYEGEELTYDYHFPNEEDDEHAVRILCRCGSGVCRHYVN